MSELGLGGAGLHGAYGRETSERDAVEAVHRALELGIRFIDTSAGYGRSEERIGIALRGLDTTDLFVASKTGTGDSPRDYSRDGTLRSVERSLFHLGIERLDLMQIHDPDDLDASLAPGGALEALIELKEQGVVGAIGLGVRDHTLLLQAIRHGAFDTILTYADLNLIRQTARESLFPEAVARDVGILLGSPLLTGYLTDRPWQGLLHERGSTGADPDLHRVKRIRDWAERHAISITRLALRYCLADPRVSVVLIGAASADEVERSVRAATDPLPAEVWAQLRDEVGVPEPDSG